MDAVTTVLFYGTLGGSALLELSLRIRECAQAKGSAGQDRGTRILIGAALGVAIAIATKSTTLAPSQHMPEHRAVGLSVMWLGLAIRVWAITELGRGFRTTVEVDAGLLLIMTGFGFGFGAGNWLALAACVVLPTVALLRRIRVEEAELTRVLGDAYRAYQKRTKRLIPGLWCPTTVRQPVPDIVWT